MLEKRIYLMNLIGREEEIELLGHRYSAKKALFTTLITPYRAPIPSPTEGFDELNRCLITAA
jgi:hypothetical protein